MLFDYVVLTISLIFLTLGAELLVRGSVAIATRMGVSSFFIGVTLVGFGTSMPELAASVAAALQGQPGITMGNVVGSSTFNIAMVLGITAVLVTVPVSSSTIWREVPLIILVAFAPYAALLTGGYLGRVTGIIFLVLLFVILWDGYRRGRIEPEAEMEALLVDAVEGPKALLLRRPAMAALVALGGLVVLIVSSSFLVDSSVSIARSWGISELVIGLTVVAVGTSAPELVTSLVGIIRKESDLSVGNILGSNIFNMIGIAGVAAIVSPQFIPAQVYWLDAPFLILLSLACIPIMRTNHRISRGEGVGLLALYGGYVFVLLYFAPTWFPAEAIQ